MPRWLHQVEYSLITQNRNIRLHTPIGMITTTLGEERNTALQRVLRRTTQDSQRGLSYRMRMATTYKEIESVENTNTGRAKQRMSEAVDVCWGSTPGVMISFTIRILQGPYLEAQKIDKDGIGFWPNSIVIQSRRWLQFRAPNSSSSDC